MSVNPTERRSSGDQVLGTHHPSEYLTEFLNMAVVVCCFIHFLAAPLSPKCSLEEKVKKKSITQALCAGSTVMEQTGGIQLYRGGPRGSEDRLSIRQQSAFAGLKAKTHCPALVRAHPGSQGSDPSPLFGTCMAALRVPGQVLGFLKKKCTIKTVEKSEQVQAKAMKMGRGAVPGQLKKVDII